MSAVASMPVKMQPQPRPAPVPACAADALVAGRIRERRQELAEHNEDVAAIGLEGEDGARVSLAILRVLAARALPMPHLVIPAPAGERLEPVAFDVLTRGSETARSLAEALRDGLIDSGEALRLCPAARELYESLGALLALLESRMAA